jgi:hypothetical protein
MSIVIKFTCNGFGFILWDHLSFIYQYTLGLIKGRSLAFTFIVY